MNRSDGGCMTDDPYLERMIEDLKSAEYTLRADLASRHNEFRTDGEQRVVDAQSNVDRLHELIRSYKGLLSGQQKEKREAPTSSRGGNRITKGV